jgi:type I restriction enzyme S subunit
MSEWKEGAFSEIAEIIMGQSPKGETCNENGSGKPLLNGPTEFGIKFPAPVQFTIEPTKLSKVGDILFCVRGSTTGKMNWADQEYVIGRGIAAIRHKNGNEYQAYVKAVLDNYLPSLLASATGSTFPNVSRNQLEQIEILLPPLPEQRAIASVLSSLDDKIDLLHRQNKTLEAMADTLFRQVVTPADAGGDEADIRTIQLGDVIEILDSKRIPLSSMERDKMKTGVLYPYYGAATIMDYINKYIFDGEYLLLGEDGTVQTNEGFPILQLAVGKYWVNNHTHVINAKRPFSNFLLYTILRKTSVSHIVSGAVQPKINQENLKSLQIDVPSDDQITKVVAETDKYWEKMQLNNTQIRTLEKLRDTLLPKLMAGEVRVDYKKEAAGEY